MAIAVFSITFCQDSSEQLTDDYVVPIPFYVVGSWHSHIKQLSHSLGQSTNLALVTCSMAARLKLGEGLGMKLPCKHQK